MMMMIFLCAHDRLNGLSDFQKRNNFQICPRRDSNTGDSDLWSSTLPLDHGGAPKEWYVNGSFDIVSNMFTRLNTMRTFISCDDEAEGGVLQLTLSCLVELNWTKQTAFRCLLDKIIHLNQLSRPSLDTLSQPGL